MVALATIREILRSQDGLAMGCMACEFRTVCGGIHARSCFDCFSYCPRKCQDCDVACPKRPVDFSRRMREVGGLNFDHMVRIAQKPIELPVYVPVIHHKYGRLNALDWPVVALETYSLFRIENGEYRGIVDGPEKLRHWFKLRPDAQIILRGTAPDPSLEKYWAHRRRDHAAEQLAKLGPMLVIGPNFSHFLDVPRTDNLVNRKRQLLCLTEMAQAGLCPVPHLSAATPHDWIFWRNYLRENEGICFVAVEFQTGNRNIAEGSRIIKYIDWLQEDIGRPLHPIAIGAGHLVEKLACHFHRFTIMDSRPFMNAIKRRSFCVKGRKGAWLETPTLTGFPIDFLVLDNIRQYTDWIKSRARLGSSTLYARRRVI